MAATDETAARPRNRIVMQRESGHPGYTNHLVIADEAALLQLGLDIERLARAPNRARFDRHVTRRGEPDSQGSIAFVKCSPAKLDELQRLDRRARYRRWAWALFLLTTGLLALRGLFDLVRLVY